MVNEVQKYLTGISIGMRFGPSFSVCDQFGNIIDYLLYDEDSYFDKEMFPRVNTSPFQTRLENPETGDYFSISQQDVILNCNFAASVVEIDPSIVPKIKMGEIEEIKGIFRYS